MYFRLGGGTVKGVSRPGEVVWSRVYVDRDKRGAERLSMDIGRCRAVELPAAETQRRWDATTGQWPIMHAVMYGVTRDQMMARHQSNHIQVVYGQDAAGADRIAALKAALAEELGVRVHACGRDAQGAPLGRALARAVVPRGVV
jgi:L-fucose isomerase-like protein